MSCSCGAVELDVLHSAGTVLLCSVVLVCDLEMWPFPCKLSTFFLFVVVGPRELAADVLLWCCIVARSSSEDASMIGGLVVRFRFRGAVFLCPVNKDNSSLTVGGRGGFRWRVFFLGVLVSVLISTGRSFPMGRVLAFVWGFPRGGTPLAVIEESSVVISSVDVGSVVAESCFVPFFLGGKSETGPRVNIFV